MNFFYFFVLIISCVLKRTCCLEKELTVIIDPLMEECYYQSLKVSDSVEIEYQVIDGGHGDLDIIFTIIDPTGRILVNDFKKSENSHKFDVTINGDFKLCFDNRFSTFNAKAIFFELIVDNDIDDQWGSEEKYNFMDNEGDVKIEDVHEVVNTLRNHLNKVRLLQDMIKSTEAKDRNVAEETYFKVNIYSLFILIVMILVSFIQIVMVKSLFDNKSKVHLIWDYLDKYK